MLRRGFLSARSYLAKPSQSFSQLARVSSVRFSSKAVAPVADESQDYIQPKDLPDCKSKLKNSAEFLAEQLGQDDRTEPCKNWLAARKADITIENEVFKVTYSAHNYNVLVEFNKNEETDENEEEEAEAEAQQESEPEQDDDKNSEEKDEEEEEEKDANYKYPSRSFMVTLHPVTKEAAKLRVHCKANRNGEMILEAFELAGKDGKLPEATDPSNEIVFFDNIDDRTHDLFLDLLGYIGIDDDAAKYVQAQSDVERVRDMQHVLKKLAKWSQL